MLTGGVRCPCSDSCNCTLCRHRCRHFLFSACQFVPFSSACFSAPLRRSGLGRERATASSSSCRIPACRRGAWPRRRFCGAEPAAARSVRSARLARAASALRRYRRTAAHRRAERTVGRHARRARSIASSSTARWLQLRAALRLASADNWGPIEFCNGGPAAASHFLPRFDRPRSILNPGAGDAERQLAWRGVALVGSVKSDRLVDVTERGTPLAEALGVRARGDSTGRRVERRTVERAIGSRRVRDSHRRSRRPGRRRGAPAAGGGHVSRDCDLRRQHRDSCGPVHRPAACVPRAGRAQLGASRHPDADGVRLRRRRRIVGRPRDADGRDLLRGAAVRSPDPASQCGCADCGDSVLRRSSSGRRCRLRADVRRDARHSRGHVEARRSCFRHRRWLRAPAALLVASACAEIALLPIGALCVFARHLRRPHRQLSRPFR